MESHSNLHTCRAKPLFTTLALSCLELLILDPPAPASQVLGRCTWIARGPSEGAAYCLRCTSKHTEVQGWATQLGGKGADAKTCATLPVISSPMLGFRELKTYYLEVRKLFYASGLFQEET